MRRRLILVLLAAAAPAAAAVAAMAAPVTGAGAIRKELRSATPTRAIPSVQIMVVGRTRTLLAARSAKLNAGTVRIGHRRCSVPAGTAIAGLLAARLKPKITDAAGCDPSALFVTRIGPDANRGFAGWEYKVDHTSPSPGAGDPQGRLRSGQRLLWFWCVRASACQRTLEVSLATGVLKVLGYDDNGHAKPVAGATVRLDNQSALTGSDGTAHLAIASGTHTASAMKSGFVPSFPLRFTATP